ncbi:MAG: hypothetical protein LBH62_09205 [Nitrososphaerota archaeon]|nr:hypothetical protein [Nitrososphaerota archaeon]
MSKDYEILTNSEETMIMIAIQQLYSGDSAVEYRFLKFNSMFRESGVVITYSYFPY